MPEDEEPTLTEIRERLLGMERRFEVQRRLTLFFIGLVAIYVALDLMTRFS